MNNKKDYHKLSDKELIKLYRQNNDEKAITMLLNKYERDIKYAILNRLGNNNQDALDDLLQEVRNKIIEKIKTNYNERSQFRSWVKTLAKNTAIDFTRKKKNEIPVGDIVKGDPELEEMLMRYFSTTEKNKIPEKAVILLRELINELPPEQKEVIILHIYQKLEFKEIAKITNASINTAISRMKYARDKLKNKILTDPRGKIILDLIPKYKHYKLKFKRRKPNLH